MKNNANALKKNAIYSALAVTLMMLFFKAFGFVKQAVIAFYFGTNAKSDAYFIAYGFINGISEVLSKSISFSIIPIYTSTLNKHGKEKANQIVNGIFEILIPISFAIMLIFITFSTLISNFLAPNYSLSSISLISNYIILLSPIMLFSIIELLFGSILDVNREFFASRLQSFIYSLAVIISCIAFSSTIGVASLILGQYISSIVYTIILLIIIRKYWKFSFANIHNIPEIREVLLKAVPLFIGYGVLQINQIVDKSIASSLVEGSASALAYCHTLEQFVTNIMIVNIGNVLFTHFSDYASEKKYDKLSETLCKAYNIIICILIPISIITIFHSINIVKLVYYRGNFNSNSLYLTASVLIGYATSFLFVGIRDLTMKTLYALKNTLVPMISSIISIIINIFLSILLSKKFGIIGISFATSISSMIGMILNCILFRKIYKIYDYRNNYIVLIKNIPSIIFLLLLCLCTIRYINNICGFIICTIFGIPIYMIILKLNKVPEVLSFLKTITGKLRKRI